ncbi:hypothetical protein GWI33_004263 [Rhynchophorus ferrugineus]|uniref:Uncharacterized protein n=1 Tax=Rhynchophorus ferrugineus TaxID=354439 RepID=A0A834IJ14_RHYFE|nr:hypothetical protein GWI33_004263 [Rhynchophorus ferrugineus]
MGPFRKFDGSPSIAGPRALRPRAHSRHGEPGKTPGIAGPRESAPGAAAVIFPVREAVPPRPCISPPQSRGTDQQAGAVGVQGYFSAFPIARSSLRD